jgi:hypothetical protein
MVYSLLLDDLPLTILEADNRVPFVLVYPCVRQGRTSFRLAAAIIAATRFCLSC